MRYWVETYGCQMNERDSEVIAGLLEKEGYKPADSMEDADLLLINTCCVRESAERKIIGKIGQLKSLKAERPGLIIGVAGCMTQQEGLGEKLARKAPHVDFIVGTHNIHEISRIIREVEECRGETLIRVFDEAEEVAENLPSSRGRGVSAWVNIMYGCNNFCTYCIVPYVRGRERSRRPSDILQEIRGLAEQGYKEVTLLGQNVNTYGRGLEEDIDFADLLLMVDKVDGIERIRYTTSHPRDFTDKMIEAIASSRKVCEHFHLPVQAGSNSVLERMKRGYSRESYMDLVERIRRRIPGASLTTDIIVGFPGETEEDFEETLDLVERVEFDNAFTFMFSPRSGTAAARMPDQIPLAIKKSRLQRLMEVQYPISRRKNEALVGTIQQVLAEGPSKKDPRRSSGRTRTNKIVLWSADGSAPGQELDLEITGASTWTLEGAVRATHE